MNIRDEVIDLFENVIEKSRRLGVAATPVILANELLASSVFRRIQEGALREVDPTDDEREALWDAFDDMHRITEGGCDTRGDHVADMVLGLGFRRTEVPEPSVECPQPCVHLSQEDAREGRTCDEHPCTCREPQGEPSDAQVLGLVRRAQGIVDSMKSSAGRRTRGDEWCYVRYGQVSALEEVLGGMGKVSAPLDDDVVEAGADYLWRRLTAVGTKPGPAMTECQEIIRAALRAAGDAR